MPKEGSPPVPPDVLAAFQHLCRATQELTAMAEVLIAARRPTLADRFVPTPFQQEILEALDGKALRTDALGHAVGNRRRLFIDPGGLPELQDVGKVQHSQRLGYFRPDAPPQELAEKISPNND